MESECQKISLEKTKAFSKELLDYINQKPELKPFYSVFPDIEGFKKLISGKYFSSQNRETLVAELEKQYSGISTPPDFKILKSPKTFTVTTGHQLNIFSGPLYIIYKIITIINLAKDLKKSYPDFNFVPVYWMATEDHDLEEIDHFSAFGQKYHWKTYQKGAVGRMNTEGLPEIAEKLGKDASFFQNAYKNNSTLADAVREYMHHLFGKYGLITIDADSRAFKEILRPVMADDINLGTAFSLVNKQSEALQQLGYKTQISPREINFFYLKNSLRERLIQEGSSYSVLNSDIKFSKEELEELIDKEPEKLSPNVVLRPLYQEMILPNLAYIGGPSEIVYWLQLKPVFDHYDVQFPALMPRNLALLADARSCEQIEDLQLDLADLFLTKNDLKTKYVSQIMDKQLNLQNELTQLKNLYAGLSEKAQNIDITLARTSEAFETKSRHLLEAMEKKLIRAEKKNHAVAMGKIEKVKEALFPGDGLQERKDNYLSFIEKNPNLISELIKAFDPLDYRFNIILLKNKN